MNALTVGSLFAGIGGFDLGLERAGMRVVWQCEQDPFCQRVLARHWPGVPCHPDVRTLVADTERSRLMGAAHGGRGNGAAASTGRPGRLGEDAERVAGEGRGDGSLPVSVPYVDVLCGGFPCQDISLAGRGAGLAGERSGLWREFARLIGELRPRYVLVENVPALTSRGLDVVLADLAACGFDAEWDHLPASAFGAPHQRDRIWLVAYRGMGDADGAPAHTHAAEGASRSAVGERGSGTPVAHADGAAGNGTRPAGEALPRPGEVERLGRCGSGEWHPWLAEPDVRGVAPGLSEELDGGLNGRQGNGSVASPSEGPEGRLRDVWEHVATRAASSGRGSDEQLARELADALPAVPHGMALGEREGALAATRAYVQGLRQALSSLGAVSDPSQPLAPAWLALPREDQDWIDLGVAGGQWAAEWPGVERVAVGIPNRVDRLRALGNALVPQIAEWIGRQIVEWELTA